MLTKKPGSPFWYAQFMIDGKNYAKSTKTKDKKLALKIADSYRNEVIQKLYLDGEADISIKEAMQRFIRTKQHTKEVRNMEYYARWMAQHYDVTASMIKLTTKLVEKILHQREDEGVKPATLKHHIGFLRGVWQWSKKQGFPVSQVEFPSIKVKNAKLRYLSLEEEQRLLGELDPLREVNGLASLEKRSPSVQQSLYDSYDLVVMLLDTGCRLNEIQTLQWKQVDLEQGCLHIWRSKSRNESILYFTNRCLDIMRRRRESRTSEFVFSNKNGQARQWNLAVRRAIKRAELHEVSIHTFRHTAASRLVQNGVSLQETQEILGHSTPTMTARYAHLAKNDVAKKARDALNRFSDG